MPTESIPGQNRLRSCRKGARGSRWRGGRPTSLHRFVVLLATVAVLALQCVVESPSPAKVSVTDVSVRFNSPSVAASGASRATLAQWLTFGATSLSSGLLKPAPTIARAEVATPLCTVPASRVAAEDAAVIPTQIALRTCTPVSAATDDVRASTSTAASVAAHGAASCIAESTVTSLDEAESVSLWNLHGALVAFLALTFTVAGGLQVCVL